MMTAVSRGTCGTRRRAEEEVCRTFLNCRLLFQSGER